MIIVLSVKCGRLRCTGQKFALVEGEWDLLKLVKRPFRNPKSWENSIIACLEEVSCILVDIHVVFVYPCCRQSKRLYIFRYVQQEMLLLNLG